GAGCRCFGCLSGRVPCLQKYAILEHTSGEQKEERTGSGELGNLAENAKGTTGRTAFRNFT
ncbi:MAG: hypothetical protein O2990_09090, partial [Bacteroidetes bacterium]|nr:hypothetical protein [Bacteroidota bacterium]